jgi:tRNA pseudouridine38-40 synthase
VQQRVEEAVARIFPNAGRLHSSSRTDTGVHAWAWSPTWKFQTSEFKMPASKAALAINAHLPRDIRIMAAARCRADFDARFDAKGKQYRYFVWNGPAMNPLLRHAAWHVSRPLDLAPCARREVFPGPARLQIPGRHAPLRDDPPCARCAGATSGATASC